MANCLFSVARTSSDIYIKDENFENLDNNKIEIHLLSTIPKSYPGHSILTEDLGKMEDDCNEREIF